MRPLLATVAAALAVAVPIADARPVKHPVSSNIATIWDHDRWQRGQPGPKVLRWYRRTLAKAAPRRRAAIKRRWRKSKRLYYRHRSYCRSGLVVEGRVSWFDDGITASGMSASYNAGLALNLAPGTDSGWSNSTTRGWVAAAASGKPVMFRVWIAGRTATMPVIDLGPAGWVNRAIDVSGPGVDLLGLSRSAFPTDSWGRAKLIPAGC